MVSTYLLMTKTENNRKTLTRERGKRREIMYRRLFFVMNSTPVFVYFLYFGEDGKKRFNNHRFLVRVTTII